MTDRDDFGIERDDVDFKEITKRIHIKLKQNKITNSTTTK